MKRLLLTLLAAIALPTGVNAEVANHYILGSGYNATFTLPMDSLELCEAAGERFKNNKNWAKKQRKGLHDYICVKGK